MGNTIEFCKDKKKEEIKDNVQCESLITDVGLYDEKLCAWNL